MKRSYLRTAVRAALLIPGAVTLASLPAMAQESTNNEDIVEVIEVRGLISSLKKSFSDKKEALIVSDGIAAEDFKTLQSHCSVLQAFLLIETAVKDNSSPFVALGHNLTS
jgi:hypothetical protein